MNQPIDGRKIFGIGLNKTGTTSLGEGLNRLGIKTIHYPFKKQIYDELTGGNFRLSILERYQGIVDTPVAPYYAQLDRAYPGSKFILTLREPESWLRSIAAHWPVMRQWCDREPQFRRFTDFISAVVYGCIEFNHDRFLYAYETHERNVREYFRGREDDDLLVMTICDGDGWQQLCPFLGVDVPEFEFPHSNKGKDRDSTRKWISLFDRARDDLATLVGNADSVVLVDDGKVGESVTPAGVAMSFPQSDGIYSGPPGRDEEAVEQLQSLHAKGARYVVFTWDSFWWFDSYPQFYRYLNTTHRCLLSNERVVVYELNA